MPPTPAAQALLSTFDRIIVINLPDRADRRRAIDAELRLIGLSLDHPSVELFSAIRPDNLDGFPSIGAHGAFRSHLGIMQRMVDEGWNRMLVLEDDMAFAPGAVSRLPGLTERLAARDWAIVYGHDLGCARSARGGDGLIALEPDHEMIQLHFLGLTQAAAQAALPLLSAMLDRPAGHPLGGPMHVDGALNWVRRSNPALHTVALSPALALQRPSRSDVATLRWFDRVPLLSHVANHLRDLNQRLR